MPGASAPIIDTWAPAQYVWASGGGAGPLRSPDDGTVAAVSPTDPNATYDGTLHVKLAGTILLALIGVFVLQAMGFRFVVAVGG